MANNLSINATQYETLPNYLPITKHDNSKELSLERHRVNRKTGMISCEYELISERTGKPLLYAQLEGKLKIRPSIKFYSVSSRIVSFSKQIPVAVLKEQKKTNSFYLFTAKDNNKIIEKGVPDLIINFEDCIAERMIKMYVCMNPKDQNHSPVYFRSKTPKWNIDRKRMELNFHNRARRPSLKNFQLVMPSVSQDREVMQFGRMEEEMFSLDYSPDFTDVQALAIALCRAYRSYYK